MSFVKKRSSDGLLKAAKRMCQEKPESTNNEQQRRQGDSTNQKRSSDGLLKAAKRMCQGKPEYINNKQQREQGDSSKRSSKNIHQIVCHGEVKITENQRNRSAPNYIGLPPAEFMSWWITTTRAKRKASNILLKYMKYKFDLLIPTDYRTLLGTPIKPVPKNITPGSYVHLGLNQALMQLMSEGGQVLSTNIFLQFFIDGLQISKSTKEELWIIMVNLRTSKTRLIPKVIGLHHGEKKPGNYNEFLWPFVMELLQLLENGFVSNGKVLKLNILNFVLDAPARTSSKAVTHVTGYYGCDYCLAEGDSIDHRMAFLDLEAPLRNDLDYRSRKYDDYHKAESVLELLPIDMVNAFPPDYLHCALLGIMHWILTYIREAPKMLSSEDYRKIKERVEMFRKTQPVEFQRKLRTFIEYLGLMKGTEFRQHLLFVFPLLLEDIVSEEIIQNFLKLHIASIIFSHKRFSSYYNEADELMRMFILEFAEVYHPRHVVYCCHSLCHMKKFVCLYGPWDNFSTFEYETYNSTVKNLLQGNVMPLTQIANRIVEIYNAPKHQLDGNNHHIEIKDRQPNGTFSQLKFYDLTFTTYRTGQNFVLLKSGEAVKLVSISYDTAKDEVILTGLPFKHRSSVYTQVNTMRFNIFKSEYKFNNSITFGVEEIDGKMWKLDYNSNMSAYYPLYVEDGKTFSRRHNEV